MSGSVGTEMSKMESMEERLLRQYFGENPVKLGEALKRLQKREPLAYILGEVCFFREFYYVTPAVLIPRSDTERVVEKIVHHLPEGGRMLELCTGSGCITVSTLCSSKRTTSVAVDISEDALEIAKKNAERNSVDRRVKFLQGDIFKEDLWESIAKFAPFDVIAANPPYVRSSVVDSLEEECHYEPAIAFDGGEDGMDFYREILRRIFCCAPALLKDKGRIIFEIGYDQRKDILRLAEERGLRCAVTKDYGGNDRVAVLKNPEKPKGVNMDITFKNPIDPGLYADPEARCYEGKYYIYVTKSLPFGEQQNQDCFVSEDLQHFRKVENVIDMEGFPYVTHAVWAPTIIEKNGRYYYVFASNNIQKDGEPGGLEIAVSDSPEGPFKAYLGHPLVDHFVHGAQPIDAHLFKDDDGKIYLLFGGWGHCVLALMNEDMTGFVPCRYGKTFLEITPPDYVEGPCMMKKDGWYYFMWSAGSFTDGSYHVNYCRSKSIFGPYERAIPILWGQPPLADGPGHHGYLVLPDGQHLIVYHRRTVGDLISHHRYICIDKMEFDAEGNILPVIMT